MTLPRFDKTILLCLLTALLTLFFSKKLLANPIISGISANEIEIDTSFKGAKILLFGAKGYVGNVVVAVRGPKKDFIITKKDRIFGVWYNGKRVNLRDSYSYYSLFSTFSDQKLPEQLLSDLELGKDNLSFNFYGDIENKNDSEDFKLYFIDKLEQEKLYSTNVKKVSFLNETLFKVMLEFPKTISRGTYSVDIYLIDDGSLISYQSIPIYVKQTGISAKIFDFAHKESFLYAVLSISIALFVGWFTNFCFCRFFGQ